MSETPSSMHDGLLSLIGSALDDLNSGRLDAGLPSVGLASTDRERELVGHLRDVIVSRRRAAEKLHYIAAAIESALGETRDRVAVATNANAEVAESALACDEFAGALSESARRVSGQAVELHELIASAADATSNLAESGRDVTRDSDTLSVAVGDVAAAAAAIAASMKEIDGAISGLAGEVTTTSNAVTALNSSIHSINLGAAEASALSTHMSEAAANGIEVVRQTAEAVASINAAVDGLGRSMDQLVTRSEEVTHITKIIQRIAVQAKLLALNASIQAAHAGEAGRGFAVVAREIKQLSDSTTDSTREIEDLVRSILGEITFSREEARSSGERAERGLQLANAASVALDAIFAEAELIRSRVLKISDATSSQTEQTSNLKGAVGRVADLADQLRKTAADRILSSQKVLGRVREISDLAFRVRTAMADQEDASLGLVTIIERLISVAGALETAVQQRTDATEELASAVTHIYEAGRQSQASVAAMAYSNGLLDQNVAMLREEVELVQLPAPIRGGRIVVPLTMRGVNFDPVHGYSESHTSVLECLFEPLVVSKQGGRVAPALAERWEVSGDGLVWTFHLRRGVRFHHGRELTSDDVLFSFERLARDADEGAFILAPVRGVNEYRSGAAATIDGIATPDPHTVVVTLVEPIAFFLGLLALTFAGIQPRDYVDANPDSFALAPVGSGPYKVRYLDDDRLIVERFTDHRDDRSTHLDEIEFDFKVTAEQSLEGVLSGRYAFTKYVPRARLPELLASAEWRSQVQSITQPHCQYLLINGREGHVADARARRAIAHAIDRAELVRLYSAAPVAVVAEGLVPPSCPGYEPSYIGPVFDLALARALLAESGYDTSRPLDLVLTKSPWTLGADAVERISDWLGAIGLRLETRASDDLNETRRTGAFDLMEAAWYGDYLDPDTFTFGAFHSRLGAFYGYFDCDELDSLFERARSTSDPAHRAELYREAQRLFTETCPAVVLLHRRDYIVHSHRVEGVQLYPLLPTVRPRDIWVTQSERSE
jgi:peptide/nickel transport system substrate-binding protein/oligopeptide transport system substrate-binding protein